MNKIIIIRFSSIGDIVMTSKAIRNLRVRYPKAILHYLTKPQFVDLVVHNPHIDKVITLDTNLITTIKKLQLEQYDAVVDLHNNLRSTIIKLVLNKKTVSVSKNSLAKRWMCITKNTSKKQVHFADKCVACLYSFDVKNDGLFLDFYLPQGFDYQHPITSQQYICVVVGALKATKSLPKERLLEMCKSIAKPVVLIGGRAEINTAQYIANQLLNCINLCGELSLLQSAYIIKNAEKIITHDTGMMHIAAAFNKRIYSIWGNTVPAFGMYPFMPSSLSIIAEVQGLKCRPCSHLGFDTCPKLHFNCMQNQRIDAIANWANKSEHIA